MEILINELSLGGQYSSIQHFVKDGLVKFISVLKELNTSKDVLFKKQDFWMSRITPVLTLHDVLIHKSDETTRFKSILNSLIDEPFWETSQKHDASDIYVYDGNIVSRSSLAESCERDKIMISFIHSDFSNPKLQVLKNQKSIEVDNLFQKEHYIEVAYSHRQIDKCAYLERKISFGLISILENECRFTKTKKLSKQNTPIYKENNTGHYWHLDNFHTQHEEDVHYEVYDSNEKHIGTANIKGVIDYSKKVNGRTL